MPRSGTTQTVLSWSLSIDGAREEVRFIDHFENDTRLISVEGEPQADRHRGVAARSRPTTRPASSGQHRGFAPLWLFEQRNAADGCRAKRLSELAGVGRRGGSSSSGCTG